MFKKSRALAVAVATAGVLGFGAPMASAATTYFGPGDNGGLSQDQALPTQLGGSSDPTAGSWAGDNGGWGNKHHKQQKEVQGVQVCNIFFIIKVNKHHKWDDPTSDPSLTSDPSYASDPSLSSDPSYASDPSLSSDPSYASDPSLGSDQGLSSDPSYASDPGKSVSFLNNKCQQFNDNN
jgi:hypothetical protein